jgi:predicted DNA-binding transcriptional regulator AlpA
MPRYVSASTLADRYSVAERTIWRWSRAGTIPPPHKLTEACTRWDMDEIESAEARRAARREAS